MTDRPGAEALARGGRSDPALRAQAGAARDPFLAGGWDLYLLAAAAMVPIAVPAGPAGITILDVLNGAALVLVLTISARCRVRMRFPFALPILLISARSLLAVTNAVSVPASLAALLQDAYLYLWLVALVALMSRRGDLRRVRLVWLGTASAIAVVSLAAAILQRNLSLGHLLTASGSRLQGTFGNPNVFADYLMFSVFIGLGLVGQVRARVLAPSLGLLLVTLLATKSNGGLAALSAGLAVWLPARAWFGGVSRTQVAGVVSLALAAVLLAGWAGSEWGIGAGPIGRLGERSLFGRISHSSESRREIWRRLERYYRRFPLGIGPGNSSYQMVPIGERERPDSFQSKEAHSDYLAYAVERGPLALVALLVWMAQAFGMVLGARRRLGEHAGGAAARAILLASLLGALVGTSVHSLVIEKLHFRHFWMFLALVCAMTAEAPAPARAAARPGRAPGPATEARFGALATPGGEPS